MLRNFRQLLLITTLLVQAGLGLAQTSTPSSTTSPTTMNTATPGVTPASNPYALKIIILGRRKPGTTLVEHRQHIRRVHGEMVLKNIEVDGDNAPRRYAQNAVIDGYFRSTPPAATEPLALNRDFVTQVWFPDFAALGKATKSEFYLKNLKPDEDNFVDQANVFFVPSKERVLKEQATSASVPGTGNVKLFGVLQRAPNVSVEDFRRAWMASNLGAQSLVQRQVQNDPLPTPNGPPKIDGIDEFWFANEADARIFLKQWQA